MERELLASKEQAGQLRRLYETVTSNTPDLMYVFDLNYRFIYANKALLNMWGKTWENAVGKGLLDNGYEPWHAEMHEREIDQVRSKKLSIRGEVSFPHATLGRRVYDYIFTPVFDESGEVEAVAGTTRDITERKHFEESLAKSSNELQSFNEEIESVNEELAASNEELRASNEELVQMQLAFQQETQSKQIAIEELKANDQNIRNMVLQSPVGMCILQGDPLYVTEVNDAFLKIIGKTHQEIKLRPYWEIHLKQRLFTSQ